MELMDVPPLELAWLNIDKAHRRESPSMPSRPGESVLRSSHDWIAYATATRSDDEVRSCYVMRNQCVSPVTISTRVIELMLLMELPLQRRNSVSATHFVAAKFRVHAKRYYQLRARRHVRRTHDAMRIA